MSHTLQFCLVRRGTSGQIFHMELSEKAEKPHLFQNGAPCITTLRSAHPLPVECLGDASPSTEDASPVPSSQVQSNPVGLTGAYFRGPASPPSSARPHNHAPVHTSVHNDRPSTPPIPRGCLLTPCGSGPVVSLHARARTRTRTRHAPLAHHWHAPS